MISTWIFEGAPGSGKRELAKEVARLTGKKCEASVTLKTFSKHAIIEGVDWIAYRAASLALPKKFTTMPESFLCNTIWGTPIAGLAVVVENDVNKKYGDFTIPDLKALNAVYSTVGDIAESYHLFAKIVKVNSLKTVDGKRMFQLGGMQPCTTSTMAQIFANELRKKG